MKRVYIRNSPRIRLSHLYQFTVSSLHLHTLYPSKFNILCIPQIINHLPRIEYTKGEVDKVVYDRPNRSNETSDNDRTKRRVTGTAHRTRSGNSSVASPSCNTLSTIICIPPLSQQIAAKTRFTPRVRTTRRAHIYIYMNIKYIKREMEGEGRKGSCSHRHDLILLGQNLFGFLCARPRRLPAESIIYPVVLFVQRSANQRADGIESGASLTREEEREGRVGQGRSWISRSDKTFHLILDSRFRVYILSSDR